MLAFIDQVKWFTCSKAQNVWWELNWHLLNLCRMFQLKDAPSSLHHFSLNKNEPVQESQPEADKGSGLFSRSGWELQEQKMCVRSVATSPIFIFYGHLTGLAPKAAAIPAVCGALYLRQEWHLLSFQFSGLCFTCCRRSPTRRDVLFLHYQNQHVLLFAGSPEMATGCWAPGRGAGKELPDLGIFFCLCGAGERLLCSFEAPEEPAVR